MSLEETRKTLLSVLERGVDSSLAEIYEGRFIELKTSIRGETGDTWSLWIYMGRERDYVLVPYTYCSCMDFLIRTVFLKIRAHCKHQLGLLVAMKKKLFKTLDVVIDDLYVIINEILEKGFSPTLRRKLYK